MNLKTSAFCFLCLLLTINMVAEGSIVESPVTDSRLFDQYGDIQEEDEMARLDNVAVQLQNEPRAVAHIIVYGGRRSCVREAQARARRAKDYLVQARGIGFDRIIWRDGGFREELTVEVYLLPRESAEPLVIPTVSPGEVKLTKRCKRRSNLQGAFDKSDDSFNASGD